jgi:hypothetical protein
MKLHFPYLFILIFCTNLAAQSNKILLKGTISEQNSQERLLGASLYVLGANTGVVTDAFGYYNLYLSKGKTKIVASYVGFQADTISLTITKDTVLNIVLEPLALSEVVISEHKINNSERIGVTSLPMEQLKSIPAILGEADVLRGLTMLPGVNNGTEGTVGLNVRGGSPDQNLILLDGATIYNASHLFGFLSAFNADAIKKVELHKGGFPSRYGGRLSSIIDISFKDGNKQSHSGDVGIGVLASKFFVEGPLKQNKISYMIAGRSSYLGLINRNARKEFEVAARKEYTDYKFYDINAKVNFVIKEKGSLSASFYRGNDYYLLGENMKAEFLRLKNTVNWNSTVGNLQYIQPIGKKMIYNTQLSYNRYYSNFGINIQPYDSMATDNLHFDNNTYTVIHDLSYKNNFNYSLNEKHALSFGTELIQQFFKPNIATTILNGENIGLGGTQNTNLRKALNYAAFGDISTQWTEKCKTLIGVRFANYAVEGTNFHYIEPRLSLSYDANAKNSIKASFSRMNQFVHLLSNNTLGFANDAWVPATKRTAPEGALQYALGYVRNIPAWNSYISIETFYKKMDNLIEYSEASNPTIDNATKGWEQIIQKNGLGRAYGIEFLLHKETGRFNGFIEYTWSKAERQFDKINQGKWYASRFDRRHDFGITANYKLTERWGVSSSFLFSTGAPFSGPNYFYLRKDPSEDYYKPFITLTNPGGHTATAHYTSKNNLRLPNYHRLDLAFTRTRIKDNDWESIWSFGAYNAYNHKNVIAESVYIGSILNSDFTTVLGVKGYAQKRTLFPLVPYISYNLKFK